MNLFEEGVKVQVFLRTGLSQEGIIVDWGSQVVLRSETSNNLLVIMNPAQDIMLVKIIRENSGKLINNSPLSEIPQRETDFALRLKNLAELKKQANELERAQIKEHLTTFEAKPIGEMIAYGQPRLDQSLLQRPPKKIG